MAKICALSSALLLSSLQDLFHAEKEQSLNSGLGNGFASGFESLAHVWHICCQGQKPTPVVEALLYVRRGEEVCRSR